MMKNSLKFLMLLIVILRINYIFLPKEFLVSANSQLESYPISYFPGEISISTPVGGQLCTYNQSNAKEYIYALSIDIIDIKLERDVSPSPKWYIDSEVDIEILINNEKVIEIKQHEFTNIDYTRDIPMASLSICLQNFIENNHVFTLKFTKASGENYSYIANYQFTANPTSQDLENLLGNNIPEEFLLLNLDNLYVDSLVESFRYRDGFLVRFVTSQDEFEDALSTIAGETIELREMETPYTLSFGQFNLSWWKIKDANKLYYDGIFKVNGDHEVDYDFFVDRSQTNLSIVYLIVSRVKKAS